MQRGPLFKAADLQTLIQCLRAVGQSVGPRTGPDRRSKEDKELFVFRRYAATLAAHGKWPLPCSVTMGESPDFMIAFPGGERGLEVTEATTEAFQRWLTRSESQPDLCDEPDDGSVGDIPEREWCKDVVDAIEAKVRLIHGYRPARHHDIVIYSSHPTDVVRKVAGRHTGHNLLQELAAQHASSWRLETRLGTIGVIDDKTLIYDLLGSCERLPINEQSQDISA